MGGHTDLLQRLLVLLLESAGSHNDIQPEVLALFALSLSCLLEARKLGVYAALVAESLPEVFSDTLYITIKVPLKHKTSAIATRALSMMHTFLR